jgi:hypothetical protein
MAMTTKSLEPVVQVIWLIMNVRPVAVPISHAWKSSTHTPYLARHCRQNLVGSLPRGMPKVVDYRQTAVQATNEMVMQNNTRVYLGSGRRVGIIPYVLLCFVIAISNNVLQARLP